MRKRRFSGSINNGAIADVSFLLLIFFMVVTTFNRQYKLEMALPAHQDEPLVRSNSKSDVLEIYINANDEILIADKPRDRLVLDELTDLLTSLIDAPDDNVVLLHIHPSSSYKQYLHVLDELKLAREHLIWEKADQVYNKSLKELNELELSIVKKEVRFKIREKEIL